MKQNPNGVVTAAISFVLRLQALRPRASFGLNKRPQSPLT